MQLVGPDGLRYAIAFDPVRDAASYCESAPAVTIAGRTGCASVGAIATVRLPAFAQGPGHEVTLLVEAALSARGDPGAPVDGKRLGDLTTRLSCRRGVLEMKACGRPPRPGLRWRSRTSSDRGW